LAIRRDSCVGLAQVGKGFAGRAAKASGKKEALALAEEGGESLAAVFIKVCSLLLCFFPSTLQLFGLGAWTSYTGIALAADGHLATYIAAATCLSADILEPPQGAPAVDGLCEVARRLRRLPALDPLLPTVRWKPLHMHAFWG